MHTFPQLLCTRARNPQIGHDKQFAAWRWWEIEQNIITFAHGGQTQITNRGGGEYVWVELKGKTATCREDLEIPRNNSREANQVETPSEKVCEFASVSQELWAFILCYLRQIIETKELIGDFSFLWEDIWKILYLVSTSSHCYFTSGFLL